MNEKNRILKTLSDLYDGQPWTDISILQIIKDITATQAAAKPLSGMHSIWEYLNHMIHWRTRISRVILGQPAERKDDPLDFAPIVDSSEESWELMLKTLQSCQEELVKAVSGVVDDKLETVDERFKATYYELIQGVIQHDAYHLGQAIIVKKKITQS